MIAFKVTRVRKGPFGNVLAFFNVIFGFENDGEFVGQFVFKDFALKEKKTGGYWVQGASKKRVNKDGSAVQEDGHDIYDEFFDLYLEKGKDDKWTPTNEAFNFKKALVEAAVEAYEAAADSNTGRGSAPARASKGKATPASATTKKINEDLPVSLDDGDDDLPF